MSEQFTYRDGGTFPYKGKTITITYRDREPDDDEAGHDGHGGHGGVVTKTAKIMVDDREFACMFNDVGDHGLSMWMCDEAYFMSPDIKEMARHFADYGYLFGEGGEN